MKVYNKLVRDKIPEIMKNNNAIPITRILSDEEYLDELNKKLQEEMLEYIEDGSIEELTDIQEVLLAILKAKKVSKKDFDNLRMQKVKKRGAFENKIYLIRED